MRQVRNGQAKVPKHCNDVIDAQGIDNANRRTRGGPKILINTLLDKSTGC